jgi:hypothetical protein
MNIEVNFVGYLDIVGPYRKFAAVIALWKWRKPLHCVMLIVCQPQASISKMILFLLGRTP